MKGDWIMSSSVMVLTFGRYQSVFDKLPKYRYRYQFFPLVINAKKRETKLDVTEVAKFI